MAIQVLETEKKENNLCNQYVVDCSFCGTKSTYLGLDVKFHRNYPGGYIYCLKCRRPIAHKEENRFEGGTSPEEIRTMIVANLNKQKVKTKKYKITTAIVGVSLFVVSVAMCIAGILGLVKNSSLVLFELLLVFGFMDLIASIVVIAGAFTVYENKLHRIDKTLNAINAEYLN